MEVGSEDLRLWTFLGGSLRDRGLFVCGIFVFVIFYVNFSKIVLFKVKLQI